MKREQLSNRIGNIDDRLVEQAENAPNYGRQHRNRNFRRMASVAAAIVLMVGSFVAGGYALAKTETVYVEKEQEIIAIGGSGISIILPDEWAGKYGYKIDGNNIAVYQLATHDPDNIDWYQGYLFWIDCMDGVYPMDHIYPEPGYTIASTATQTYRLRIASDVQYDPSNEEAAEEYRAMSASINKIQILLTDWMTQNSTNSSNSAKGTVTINFLTDGAVTETINCDEAQSRVIAEIIESQDYSLEQGSFRSDILFMVNGEEYYFNSTTGSIENAGGYPYSAVLSAEDLQAIMSIVNMLNP